MRARVLFVVAASALLLLATLLGTWPLFRDPATRVLDSPSIYGDAWSFVQRDINLTMWILAWDTHALTTDPLRLFHANAFYPAPYSLALSEHMLGNVPLFGPVHLATGNAVLAHQATLAATFVLAGLAMAAWLHHWTHDPVAAVGGGVLFALAPYRLWQVGNLHVISIHALPLVLLGIDLALAGRRRAGAAVLAVGLLVSSLCSYYVGYAAFVAAAVYAAARLAVGGRPAFRALGAIAAGGAAAALVVAVVTVPYVLLRQAGVLPEEAGRRGWESIAFLETAAGGVGRLASFLLTPRRDGIPQFVGWIAGPLALLALVAHRRPPRGALLAVFAAGFVLCLGPRLWLPDEEHSLPLPYAWLTAVVPGFATMRLPQRFGSLMALATTALAGLGLAALRSTVASRGWPKASAGLAAALVVAAVAAVRPTGLQTRAVPVGSSIPPVYRWLAAHGAGGALIELPLKATHLMRQSEAMYYSTVHWLPLVNGYTPYPPATHTAFVEAAERLPDPAALDRLLAVAPLRWVLVNRRFIDRALLPRWEATFAAAGLRIAATFPQATVYEVPPERR